jgi:hypothetical protein
MADFQLELDVFASTAKLEKGLKQAEQSVTRSSQKMDAELKKIDGGESAGSKIGEEFKNSLFGAVGAGAIAAGLTGAFNKAAEAMKPGAREDGMGVGYAFGEGLIEGFQSVPIVGGLGTMIGGALGAFEFERIQEERKQAAEQIAAAERRRVKILEGELEILENAKKLEEERAEIVRKRQEQSASETERYQDIQTQLFDKRMRLELQGNEEELRQFDRIREALAIQEAFNKKIAEATKDGNEALARQIALQRDSAMHSLKLLHQTEDRIEQEKRLAELNEQRITAEREIAEARAEAERMVGGATATFATAGGSFTTAASAQVNEAKLLTKISQQSRDFLAMIMQNTARMAGGLNLA